MHNQTQRCLLLLVLTVISILFATQAVAQNPVQGLWSWVEPNPAGYQVTTNLLNLRSNHGKLTGDLFIFKNGGKQKLRIFDAKQSGSEFSFLVRQPQGGTLVEEKFHGKIGVDTNSITGKIEITNTNRPVSRFWRAERESKK